MRRMRRSTLCDFVFNFLDRRDEELTSTFFACRQPVLTFRNHRPVTESLSENQVPVKTAPSIAIAKELEEKVKAEIQNKVSFFLRFDIVSISTLSIKPYHTHFTSNTHSQVH